MVIVCSFNGKKNPQGDLISRSALREDIDFQYICKCCHNVNGNVCDICPISEIEKKIDNAPTVEERPQGEWVGNAFDEHHCNRCGYPALWEEEPDDYYEVQSRFCPNCGADMKGENEQS